ncbi:BREX-1 system adenine-specific DNA-methyltransferase PglX [Leucothrix mucor]|uniref:BREX-1 system adenine-specific DNA-methyltransferase PglX n=1 Tax=Leucothrix mucor TaxID=45248 RepID=UPI0003B6BACA|nr:BREX-1 system adenine-specific DNA-methyltransferase PglX [Leucothrix mucor]
MNTSNIKSYAPKARIAFMDAVSKQAAKYGITQKEIVPASVKGDLLVIGDLVLPAAIEPSRSALVTLVEQLGYAQAIDKVAYSWFNRLCAIRYMELHDYLGHGRRVLSHPDHSTGYQLLDECLEVELPGLSMDRVRELKLDGTQDETLYRELLLAQCHALHNAMPFLFESLDDATELLLPENLTKTDSLIRGLVTAIPEEDWADIEIIGWLYQFYISDKKDEVMGKVVKSEDIPAATQLFTPNWIVKYMVQNSLGAQWLATYPDSPLKAQMEYYIEPAEQTDEVNAQLAAMTPTELNPEALTLIDPASGSGHILVEAYDLFRAIYLERGYRQRDIPQLILEKNLFGLDIDERAAQLTGFALMMKGRADDRRLFEREIKLNVMAMVDSTGFDVEGLAMGVELSDYGLKPADLTELKQLFEHTTTFGSLIQVPEGLKKKLPALKQLSETASLDLFVSEAITRLVPLVSMMELLAASFDTVVANPPYMGGKGMNSLVKEFAKNHFPDAKSDLFACFIERAYKLTKENGRIGMVTMQSWMFLSSFEKMRQRLLREKTICAMTQIGYNSFPSMNSKIAQAAVFTISNTLVINYLGSFTDLNSAAQSADKKELFLMRDPDKLFVIASREFQRIPGSPIAYWVSTRVRKVYDNFPPMKTVAPTRQGLATGDNGRFLRYWHEVSRGNTSLEGFANSSDQRQSRWFPCNKGGEFRRWYGNNEFVVNWESNGEEIKAFVDEKGKLRSRPQNESYYFREGLTWSAITSSSLSMRYSPKTHMFETKGAMCFPNSQEVLWATLGFTNSKLVNVFLSATSPTLDFHEGPVGNLPYQNVGKAVDGVELCVTTSRNDWNAYERSWEFQSLSFLTAYSRSTITTLESSYNNWIVHSRETTTEMKRLEEENNRLFIDAYGLADELTPEVPIEQITLTVNPAYRYGGKLSEEALWTRFREDTMQELISYAIGCMMGRYSLDEPGLIYAHSGNEGFDASKYSTFAADDDGIIPLTDTEWFADDACNRVVEFISKAWDASSLEQNLNFLADNLSPKKNESSRETIRRYLSTKFFKDHQQTYKKRPIYWLFSSGKQKAFECLVYLHRYNESTLSRMRTEYVIPLTAKMDTYAKKLEEDKEASSSTSEIKGIDKEIIKLHKQQAELSDFDEKLRHYADQRISLDLDDGVKVNYGRFGDLLADVKVITGKAPEVIV